MSKLSRPTLAEIDYQALFDTLPQSYVMFLTDDPDFTVAAENRAHEVVGMMRREQAIGRPVLEVWPDTSEKYRKTGVSDLVQSLRRVVKTGKADNMGVVRYDLRRPDGKLEWHYWRLTHHPFFDVEGKLTHVYQATVNITDEVRAGRQLAATQRQLDKVLAIGSIGTWLWDTVEDAVVADRNLLQLFGLRPEEGAGGLPLKRFTKAIHPEDRQRVSEAIQQAVAGQTAYEQEYRTVGRDGTVRWLIARGQAESDEDGATVRFPGVVIDISARKQAEDQLRYQKTLLEAQQQVSPEGILIVSAEGKLMSHNQLFADMWHFPKKVITSKLDATALRAAQEQLVDPDGFIKRVQAVYRGRLKSREKLYFKDGRIFDRYGSPIIGEDGTYYGYVWYFRDISREEKAERALRDSEQRLRFMAESMPQKVFTADAAGQVDYFNREWTEFTGLTFEQIRDWGWVQFIHPDDVDENVRRWKHSVKTGEPFELEHRFRRADGVYRWHLSRARPQHDEQGAIIKWFGSNTDISETKQMEEQLREVNDALEVRVRQRTAQLEASNQSLERSNQELQDFAYVASHDLQEPLRKIQAFGNLLEDEFGNGLGEGKDYLDRMRGAASRMSILIEDLLAFSRVTSKASPPIDVDLNIIAEEVVGDLEVRIKETHGRVDIGKLPIIRADALQMRQLLQNLVGNALKFARPDVPPQVSVSAKQTAAKKGATMKPGLTWQIMVEDNGIGFDEKYLDRIFAVFQRLHGRESYQGTGIGLAICRKIAERHGGSITARSMPGAGSTFIVTLFSKDTRKATNTKTPGFRNRKTSTKTSNNTRTNTTNSATTSNKRKERPRDDDNYGKPGKPVTKNRHLHTDGRR